MIVLHSYHSGIDVHKFANAECLVQVERVTDCLLEAFYRPGESGHDITYDAFDRVIGNDMVSTAPELRLPYRLMC